MNKVRFFRSSTKLVLKWIKSCHNQNLNKNQNRQMSKWLKSDVPVQVQSRLWQMPSSFLSSPEKICSLRSDKIWIKFNDKNHNKIPTMFIQVRSNLDKIWFNLTTKNVIKHPPAKLRGVKQRHVKASHPLHFSSS